MRRTMFTAALVTALAAAGSASALELKILTPPDFSPTAALPAVADAYKAMDDQFLSGNPGITLSYDYQPAYGEALQFILSRINTGNIPDVVQMDGGWIPIVAKTNALQPLNDLWPEQARQDWFPDAIKATTVDGKILGAWYYNAYRGFFYRKNVLKELGADHPPQNWDEFFALGKAAKKSGRYLATLPSGSTVYTILHMMPAFFGLGGQLTDDTGLPVFFDGKNRAALETVYGMYRDLMKAEYMPPDVTTVDENALRPFFYSDETVTTSQSTSFVNQMIADVPDLKDNLGTFAFPLPGGVPAKPVLAGYAYAITAKDPERIAAAWKFVQHRINPEVLGKINAIQGQMPVVKSIWQQPFYKNNPLMVQLSQAFANGMQPPSAFPIYAVIAKSISEQMADVVSGKITPTQAVDRARDEVMTEYKRQQGR